MINFGQVKDITIPEGSVLKITDSNGTILWQKSSNPYRRLEYIESTDNSGKGKYLIQLPFGVAFNDDKRLDIDYQLTKATFNQSSGQYYGGMLSTSNLDTRIVYTDNNTSKLVCYWNGTDRKSDMTSSGWNTNRHTISLRRGSNPITRSWINCYLDNASQGYIGFTSDTATYLSLFSQKYNGSEWSILAKLYEFSIYTQANSVKTYQHRLIPCQRKSDNAIGVYDVVDQVFYGNNGSGTFTAGPVVDDDWDGTL